MNGSADIRLEPGRVRALFLAAIVAGLCFVWLSWLAISVLRSRDLERALAIQIESNAVVLEEHLTRTLDAVVARLQTASLLASTSPGPPAVDTLQEMIFNEVAVRSISLLDGRNRVVTSSNYRNTGETVPEGVLPPRQVEHDRNWVAYGYARSHRDLYDFAGAPQPRTLGFWPIIAHHRVDPQDSYWAALVNISVFDNFWKLIDKNAVITVGIYDYAGRSVFQEDGPREAQSDFAARLTQALRDRQIGIWRSADDRLIAYRASQSHPIALVVKADIPAFLRSNRGDADTILIAAILISLALLVLIGLAYRWYIRYEASITEVVNQNRAVGAHLMVSDCDPANGRIMKVNDALLRRTGYKPEELIGKNIDVLMTAPDQRPIFPEARQTLEKGRIWSGTFRGTAKDGSILWHSATMAPFLDAWGRISRYVVYYTDVTEAADLAERLVNEKRLRQELSEANRSLLTDAHTDPLTGVANRRGFDQYIKEAKRAARSLDTPVTLLMIDLDHFKRLNDTYGHGAGDDVLRELVRRWSGTIRSSDALARLGGEEFCILLPQTGPADAKMVAEKLRMRSSEQPIAVCASSGPTQIRVTISVGMATARSLALVDIEALLRRADDALYEAKRKGRNIGVFSKIAV